MICCSSPSYLKVKLSMETQPSNREDPRGALDSGSEENLFCRGQSCYKTSQSSRFLPVCLHYVLPPNSSNMHTYCITSAQASRVVDTTACTQRLKLHAALEAVQLQRAGQWYFSQTPHSE
jgi:hypothetical protein